jgi:hypothetical protein
MIAQPDMTSKSLTVGGQYTRNPEKLAAVLLEGCVGLFTTVICGSCHDSTGISPFNFHPAHAFLK